MNNKNPAFIDCYGDLGNKFSLEMKSIIPNLDVFYDEPKNEQEIIERINGRKNIMVYMSFLSSDILNSCSGLKTISYLSTGLQTHGDLKEAKKLDLLETGLTLQYQDLKSHFPDLPDGHWYDVFTLLRPKEISYIRVMLRRGEKITKEPRIKLSTIHAAKGGEATNVVLLTDITNRVYKNYQQNPDDENRVFYVGVTRTKENLYLIEPKTTRCYVV